MSNELWILLKKKKMFKDTKDRRKEERRKEKPPTLLPDIRISQKVGDGKFRMGLAWKL